MTKRICSGKTEPRQDIFLPLLVLFLLSIPLFPHAADSFRGKVVGVSDGDTTKVMREGRAVKVRLYGIDCPEKKQHFGTRAQRFTSEMAFGRQVTVQIKTRDSYGRGVYSLSLKQLSYEKNAAFTRLKSILRTNDPNR